MLDGSQTTKTESVAEAKAREALDKTGNYAKAAQLLESWARKDPALWHMLTEPCLTGACLTFVSRVCRHDRATTWTAANYTIGGNGERLMYEGELLLNFRLPGGMPLRDAVAADLTIAIDIYRKQAKDELFKAAWLESIAKKIGKKKVGSALSEAELAELKEKCAHE